MKKLGGIIVGTIMIMGGVAAPASASTPTNVVAVSSPGRVICKIIPFWC